MTAPVPVLNTDLYALYQNREHSPFSERIGRVRSAVDVSQTAVVCLVEHSLAYVLRQMRAWLVAANRRAMSRHRRIEAEMLLAVWLVLGSPIVRGPEQALERLKPALPFGVRRAASHLAWVEPATEQAL